MTVTHLAEYLEASAARWPDRTAVVDPGRLELTYAELNRQADALAGFLAARGVRRGDRVGVVAAQERRGRRVALRHHEGRRRLRAGGLHGAGGARQADPHRLPGRAPSSSTIAAGTMVPESCEVTLVTWGRPASSYAGRGRPHRRRRSRRSLSRSRLHPLHLRLDRHAERRDADARERRELRRLVLVGLRRPPRRIASAATRRSTSICRSSTSTSRSSTARRCS